MKRYNDIPAVIATFQAALLCGLFLAVLFLMLTACASHGVVVREQSTVAQPEPSARLTREQWDALPPEAQAQIPADRRP